VNPELFVNYRTGASGGLQFYQHRHWGPGAQAAMAPLAGCSIAVRLRLEHGRACKLLEQHGFSTGGGFDGRTVGATARSVSYQFKN